MMLWVTRWIFAVCLFVTIKPMGGAMWEVGDSSTSYVYAPGLFGSPIAIGRYCPEFFAETGEVVIGTRGGNIFGDGQRITAAVFSEIDLTKPEGWFRRTLGPSMASRAFEHLLGVSVKDAEIGSKETVCNYIFDPREANIAQKEDIAILRSCLERHYEKFPDDRVVMFGDSRGAATTFNLIAIDQPPIACAIIEGIFDSIPHLIKHCWHWHGKSSWVEKSLTRFLKWCAKNYNHQGPFPIDYANKIPLEVPILLVTSLWDEVVPCECVMRLYCYLKERGCNVRILVLKNSYHREYMLCEDKEDYEACVHAFYRHCKVAYSKELADKGEEIFQQTSPSVSELQARHQLNAPCCQFGKIIL